MRHRFRRPHHGTKRFGPLQHRLTRYVQPREDLKVQHELELRDGGRCAIRPTQCSEPCLQRPEVVFRPARTLLHVLTSPQYVLQWVVALQYRTFRRIPTPRKNDGDWGGLRGEDALCCAWGAWGAWGVESTLVLCWRGCGRWRCTVL